MEKKDLTQPNIWQQPNIKHHHSFFERKWWSKIEKAKEKKNRYKSLSNNKIRAKILCIKKKLKYTKISRNVMWIIEKIFNQILKTLD